MMNENGTRPRWILKGCRHCGCDLYLDELDGEASYVGLLCGRAYYRQFPDGHPPHEPLVLFPVAKRGGRRAARWPAEPEPEPVAVCW